MPRFQGSLVGIETSQRWVGEHRQDLYGKQSQAIEQAHHAYETKTPTAR